LCSCRSPNEKGGAASSAGPPHVLNRLSGQFEFLQRDFVLDVVVVQGGGVQQAQFGADFANAQAALLQLYRVGVFQNDLVAAFAVDFVGDDVQIEEFDLFVGETILVTQRGRLLAIDRGDLRFQADHQAGYGHDRVFAHGDAVTPGLQGTGGGAHVVGIDNALTGGAAGFRKTDQQISVTVAPDFLFVHVGQQEVLGFGVLLGHAGVQIAQVVGEGADVVIMVLRPACQVLARELATCPGNAEGRGVGALAFDSVFKGGAEFVAVHEFGHDVSFRENAVCSGRKTGWSGSSCFKLVGILYTVYQSQKLGITRNTA